MLPSLLACLKVAFCYAEICYGLKLLFTDVTSNNWHTEENNNEKTSATKEKKHQTCEVLPKEASSTVLMQILANLQ